MEKCFTDQMSLFLVSGFANPLLVKVVRENKRVDLLMESAFRLCPIQPPQTQPEDIPFQPGRLQRLLDITNKCQMDETVRFGVFQIERVDPLQIVPVLYRDTDLLGGDAVTVLQSGPFHLADTKPGFRCLHGIEGRESFLFKSQKDNPLPCVLLQAPPEQ